MLLVFRAMTIGAIGACLYFILGVAHQGEPLREVQLVAEAHASASAATTTIVDVAAGVPHARIASVISLAPGERVIAVGERAVESDLEAGAAIAAQATAPGRFVDLTVEGVAGPRRVLVLLH